MVYGKGLCGGDMRNQLLAMAGWLTAIDQRTWSVYWFKSSQKKLLADIFLKQSRFHQISCETVINLALQFRRR